MLGKPDGSIKQEISVIVRLVYALALLVYSESPANASDGVPDEAACELHIFPVRIMTVVDQTQSSMGGVLPTLLNDAFSVKRPEEIAKFLRETVPSTDELVTLRSVDYAATVKGKGVRVVIHEKPFEGDRLDVKSSPPIIVDTPNCYRELILWQFYYEKGTMHKGIRTAYLYREFIANRLSQKPKSGLEGVPISRFPPDNPDEVDAARVAVRNAYRTNLLKILNKS